ncbi:hypothetical protein SNEBB_000707 [Seison nebaliae]|nr:hypothetical protein SNEBB_000707 [Seison nebaliae]
MKKNISLYKIIIIFIQFRMRLGKFIDVKTLLFIYNHTSRCTMFENRSIPFSSYNSCHHILHIQAKEDYLYFGYSEMIDNQFTKCAYTNIEDDLTRNFWNYVQFQSKNGINVMEIIRDLIKRYHISPCVIFVRLPPSSHRQEGMKLADVSKRNRKKIKGFSPITFKIQRRQKKSLPDNITVRQLDYPNTNKSDEHKEEVLLLTNGTIEFRKINNMSNSNILTSAITHALQLYSCYHNDTLALIIYQTTIRSSDDDEIINIDYGFTLTCTETNFAGFGKILTEILRTYMNVSYHHIEPFDIERDSKYSWNLFFRTSPLLVFLILALIGLMVFKPIGRQKRYAAFEGSLGDSYGYGTSLDALYANTIKINRTRTKSFETATVSTDRLKSTDLPLNRKQVSLATVDATGTLSTTIKDQEIPPPDLL